MAENQRRAPMIDIIERGDTVTIRTEADLDPKDVSVEVREGMLEVTVPRRALRPRAIPEDHVPGHTATETARAKAEAGQPEAGLRGRQERPDRSHPSGTPGAEPPLGAQDERDMWDAQRPLISEDRRTSIHLEGFSDEQANEIMEALGDDAPEEAQGGSATGSDVFPAHGGFPSRDEEDISHS
jgi:hypothetical protein